MQKPNESWGKTMWLLAGAGMGLLAGAATRWYWGLGAFVILVLVTIASQYLPPRMSTPRQR